MPGVRELQDVFERLATGLSDASRKRRRDLVDKRFTIVSNDCWGAEVYKDFGLPYATPLIGTYLMAPCFMAVARNAEEVLTSPLTFVDESRYPEVNARRQRSWYPIGRLGDAVEIQFLHYRSREEAAEKWQRRLERTAFDRLFFKLSADKDGFTDTDLAIFDALPIHKIAFSAKRHPGLSSVVTIPDYNVDGKAMYGISLKYVDIIAWLNSGSTAPRPSRAG